MKFSIIIPIYNCADFLAECLDSVLAQTYSSWECICVDDGSIDDSGDICDEYAEKDQRFIVIHKKNGGVSSARNAGLDAVKGDMVYFLDSDDILNVRVLEICAKGMELHPESDLSSINLVMYKDGESPQWGLNKEISWRNIDISKSITLEVLGIPVGSIAYKSGLVKDLRFTNLKIGEDRVFVFNVLERANCISISNYVGYGYRTRAGSAMHSPMSTIKFISDLRHRVCFLDILFTTKKMYESSILTHYEKHLTEYMASCFFEMPKRGQLECLGEWSIAMKKASAYTKFNRWYRFVMFACGICKSRIVFWLLCFVPYWLKSHGVNHQFAVIKK